MNHVLRLRTGITLAISLVVLASAAFFMAAPQAHAADAVSIGLSMQDTDANAKLNRIVLTIDNDAAATWVVNGTPGFTITQGGQAVTVSSVAISGSATADPVLVNVNLDETTTDVDTDGVNSNAVEVLYAQAGGGAACTNCIRSGAAELTAIVAGDATAANTEVDAMAPRIVSQSPVNGSVAVRSTNIVTTFSEPINISTDAIGFSPTQASTDGWTVGNTVNTIDITGLLNPGGVTVTVTTAADVATSPNAFGGAISGSTSNPWSFTVASSSNGGGSGFDVGSTPVVYSVTITQPSVVEELAAGSNLEIKWDSTGDSAMSNVNLYDSLDGGTSYQLIAKNAPNNGNYNWTLPAVDTDSAYIKIEGTDLATVLATDVSSQFQITTGGQGGQTTPPPPSDEGTPTQPSTGLSPVTGQVENVTQVHVGDYITSPYFKTVYYVDAGLIRRPFVDSQSYFTYQDSFDVVKMVTDATLPTLPLGAPMLPKAGVTLVKIMSDNHVYATVNDGQGHTQLRWISSEQLATSIYGANWADYVIDIPVTLFSKYTMGDDVTAVGDITKVTMKTRAVLND